MPNIKSVSFTDPAAMDIERIRRQQMLAMQLQQQSEQPLPTGQMAGGYFVPTSPLSHLAKALKGAQARRSLTESDQALKDMQRQREDTFNTERTALVNALRGTQAQPGVDDPTAGYAAPTPAAAPNPRALEEMNFRSPELRQVQLQQMVSQIMPKQPQRVDLGDKIGLVNEQGQIIGTLPKGVTPDARLREEGAERRHLAPSGSAQLGSQTTLATSVLNPEVVKAKQGIAQAGATRVQTNVNAFTPASEEAQRDFMKSTRATYDQLKHAPVLLDSIEKAKALIPQARGFMGPGGETLLEAAKFLNNRLGMQISTEGVKNAEELRTRIFFNIMDNLKKMDAQPSQMQQQIMMESLGKLGTDPNALPAVLDAFGDVIRGKVNLHNKEIEGAVGKGVQFPYDPRIGQVKGPVPAGGNQADPQSIVDELRRRGVIK